MKKIDNLKLTTATVGALLALISAGCAEKNENKENNIKETTGVTTTLGTTKTTQTTTYTQTLKTTGIKATTLPATTTKVVTTTVVPKYTQELTSKETYRANVEITTLPTTTIVTEEQPVETTMAVEEQPAETTMTTEPTNTVSEEMPSRATLEQINYAYEYLSGNDVKSFARMSIIQDSCAIFNNYKIKSLTNEIEKNLYTVLTDKEKERYDTLFEKTEKKYNECKYLYETLRLEEANKLFEELITNKEYINIDDIIQIYAFAINGYEAKRVINDAKNYTLEEDAIVIDGIRINSVLPQHGYTDYSNPFTALRYFSDNTTDEETMELMNSFVVNVFVPNMIRNIRVGKDWSKNEMYAYTNTGLERVLIDSKNKISEKYDIISWNYDTELNAYTIRNNDEIGICDSSSDLFESLHQCDQIEEFNNESKEFAYIGNDYEYLKELLKTPYEEKELQYTK